MDVELRKVKSPDDPNRCQRTMRNQQCDYEAAPGLKYCPMHALGHIKFQENRELNLYRITKYQQRISEIANHSKHKSLREEVAILRMLIEERMNRIENYVELLAQSPVIADLVSRVERTVLAVHKVEKELGMLLDQTQVTQLADEIVTILTGHITDPNIIGEISHQIGETLARLTTEGGGD